MSDSTKVTRISSWFAASPYNGECEHADQIIHAALKALDFQDGIVRRIDLLTKDHVLVLQAVIQALDLIEGFHQSDSQELPGFHRLSHQRIERLTPRILRTSTGCPSY